jgi:hypothetical protein
LLCWEDDQRAVILAHGLTKENKVPDAEIERARRRKAAFEENPKNHLYEGSDGKEGS